MMKPIPVNACLISGLLIACQAQDGLQTWNVEFWTGEKCTSTPVQLDSGPSTPDPGSWTCNPIPALGTTQALDFQSANDGNSYFLSFHKAADCTDDADELIQGGPMSLCEPTAGGYIAYSVLTVPGGPSTDTVSLPSASLVERQVITTATFALAAIVPAADWIDRAISRCFGLTANSDNVERAGCGSAATWSAVFSFITVFGARGVFHAARGAGQPRRDYNEPDFRDVFRYMAESNTAFVDGYTTNLTTLEPIFDANGSRWEHYQLDHVHTESGMTHSSKVQHNLATGQHIHASNNVRKTKGEKHRRLSKRQDDDSDYTAYIGWRDGLVKLENTLPRTNSLIDKLAIQLYNYGQANNKNQFCADLRGMDGGQTYRTVSYGNYGLLDGTFFDYSSMCNV